MGNSKSKGHTNESLGIGRSFDRPEFEGELW